MNTRVPIKTNKGAGEGQTDTCDGGGWGGWGLLTGCGVALGSVDLT